MKDALNITTKEFAPKSLLMDHDTFVIAEGEDSMGNPVVAMRWTYPELGFPVSHGKPVWFILHYAIAEVLLPALLIDSGNQKLNKNNIMDAIVIRHLTQPESALSDSNQSDVH